MNTVIDDHPALPEKHALFANVDEMLSPAALSEALRQPVLTVQCAPAAELGGHSGNRKEWVTLNGETQPRYLLKRIDPQNDWIMQASQDVRCRSVTLWQYGVLDQLQPQLDHTIVAGAREGEGWALLMRDVSAGLFLNAGPWKVPQVHRLLDALASMHATFWNKDELRSPKVGLTDPATLLGTLSVPTAQRLAHLDIGILRVIRQGWEDIQTLLEPDALAIYWELMFTPERLLAAIRRWPSTLVHGDFRDGMFSGGNVALLPSEPPQACAFDWQMASYNLGTVDLAWFANRAETVRRTLSPDQAAEYYRQRLEHHLGHGFEPTDWQAMRELGFLVDTLRMGCVMAFFAVHHELEANRDWLQAEVWGYNDQIRAGAKWL